MNKVTTRELTEIMHCMAVLDENSALRVMQHLVESFGKKPLNFRKGTPVTKWILENPGLSFGLRRKLLQYWFLHIDEINPEIHDGFTEAQLRELNERLLSTILGARPDQYSPN